VRDVKFLGNPDVVIHNERCIISGEPDVVIHNTYTLVNKHLSSHRLAESFYKGREQLSKAVVLHYLIDYY
jgi:hypothetical protein